MKKWITDPKCHFKNNGDDQSIHNYLFYTGQLPYAKAIPPRTGIVNTVGVDGAKFWHQYDLQGNNAVKQWPGKRWIGPVDFLNYTLTDEEGYFINSDGSRSRVVHQFDRFGTPVIKWMKSHGFTTKA